MFRFATGEPADRDRRIDRIDRCAAASKTLRVTLQGIGPLRAGMSMVEDERIARVEFVMRRRQAWPLPVGLAMRVR